MSRTYNRRSEIRRRVRERAVGMCEICGVVLDPSAPLTADNSPSMHHRYPRRSQGRDAVWNLLLLCRRCHCFEIHHFEEKGRERGWLCDHEDNENCAVLSRHGWIRLAEDGSIEPLGWLDLDGRDGPRDAHRKRSRKAIA